MLCLGIDSGTKSTRALVLDVESGEVLAIAQENYDFLPGLPAGYAEQDPQAWIDAAQQVVADCLGKIGERRAEIHAIGVSAQQHGLVALDAANEPLRPAKLWCDISTREQCEELSKEFGGDEGLIKRTGNPMRTSYTATKILWLKENEPANFRRLTSVLLPHDYLNFWLTGERQMEYGDASGTGLLDVRSRTWFQPLLKFIDPKLESMLPPLRSSRRPAGLLRSSLREEWGLAEDVIVSAGSGDNMMSAIGTGNIAPGIVTVSLGTSGTICAFATEPVIDPKGEVAAFCDGTDHWLPLTCTMNVAQVLEKVRGLFGWDLATMDREIAAAPPGAEGVQFLPYFTGERTPNLPRGSGVIHGLTNDNLQPRLLARAAIEGVTFGLAYGLRRLRELGISPNELRLTGGGSRSAVWRRIIADVLDLPAVALRLSEGAALGAAIQAAWTYFRTRGEPRPLKELVVKTVLLDETTRVEPRAETQSLYREKFLRQIDLTKKLNAGGYL